MNVLATGSSGLIGSALLSSLSPAGHRITRLVRSQPRAEAGEFYWDPQTGQLDAAGLERADAVVHLAGESIAERWTPQKKVRIRDSRVKGTRLLCDALARLENPPRVLVNASAIGYYGDRGDAVLQEESAPGSGFLAEVCREWEGATESAARAGIRVVRLRIGVVLSRKGGALARMLLPFRLGAGGRIGSGKQYMSWIAIDDLVGAIQHTLTTPELQGPINAVSPNPATNSEFTKTLGKVLGRPTLLPMPAFAVRLAFGQMGEDLLLASSRVQPVRLEASGFAFRFAELEGALRHVLGR